MKNVKEGQLFLALTKNFQINYNKTISHLIINNHRSNTKVLRYINSVCVLCKLKSFLLFNYLYFSDQCYL